MSRIRKAYETRFRALLRELNSRRIDPGVQWWSNHARQLSQRDGISLTHAFEQSVRLLRATVLTTDSLMMERGVLRDGTIPAFWLPPTLTMGEQLALVFREFRLAVREARCMTCGGELRRVEKECVSERIPPRTWRWLDEYFVCARCNQLFWHGTHWRKIGVQLANLSGLRNTGPTGRVEIQTT